MGHSPHAHIQAATSDQLRFWLEWRLKPENTNYNVALVYSISGPLNVEALASAFDAVVARHEVLRATFVMGDSGLQMRVAERGAIPLERVALDPHDPEAQNAWLTSVHGAPFDLEHGPVARFSLAQLGDERALLVMCVQHIAMDGGSIPLLAAQVSQLYAEALTGEAPAAPGTVRFAAYRAHEDRVGTEPAREAARRHWRQFADTMPLSVPLPTFSLPRARQTRGVYFDLSDALAARADAFARAEGATFFELMFGTWLTLIHRWTGAERVVANYPINRRPREMSTLFGCFVNNLPLGLRVGSTTTAREVLAQVHGQRVESRPHQHFPFSEVVADLRRTGRIGPHDEILNVAFGHTHLRLAPMELEGLDVKPLRPPDVMALWPLMLEYDVIDGVRFRLNGEVGAFPRWYLDEMAAAYPRLLDALLSNPDAPVRTLDVLSAETAERLTAMERGPTVSLSEADHPTVQFLRQAAATPEAQAVECGEQSWSYGVLAEAVGRIARALRAHGASPGDRIGLYMERSCEMVAATMGILRAGLVFVPLDPAYPPKRLAVMAQDAEVSLVIAGDDGMATVAGWGVTGVPYAALVGAADSGGELGAAPDAAWPAYIDYTSGSTGRPKGVLQTYGALRNYIHWQLHDTPMDGGDRDLNFTSMSFDVFFQEILCALAAGAVLVVPSQAERDDLGTLAALIVDRKISRLFCPYTALKGLVVVFNQRALEPQALRTVVLAGEALVVTPEIRRFFAPRRHIALTNQYGTVETHINTALSLSADADSWPERVSIGRPIQNTEVLILGPGDRRVAPGVVGELVVGGAQVAVGYWGRRDASRFTVHPERPEQRVYRTGDRARWWPDGTLEFFGRGDDQLKIRGYRVEPGEVEGALMALPAIDDAVVVANLTANTPRLVAYVVTTEPADDALWSAVSDALSSALPDHLVPRIYVSLAQIPLSPSGKADRKALSARPVEQMQGGRGGAPKGDAERLIARLFESVLGIRDVGRDQDFFASGGDSFGAVTLVAELERVGGVRVATNAVFVHPTVAQFAAVVAREAGGVAANPLSYHGPSPRHEALPLSAFQRGHWLMNRFGRHYTVCLTMAIDGPVDNQAMSAAVDWVIRRHEVFWLRIDSRRPRQHVEPPAAVSLECIDLESMSGSPPLAALDAVHQTRLQRPFTALPLIRPVLARAGARAHYLSLIAPHIATDGFSLQHVFEEIAQVYQAQVKGAPPVLPPVSLSVADYLRWEHAEITEERIEAGYDFYRRTMVGDATFSLPRRVLTAETHGEVRPLPGPVIDALSDCARQMGISLASVLSYCAFVTAHRVFDAPLMRCLASHDNRDRAPLRRFPFMMANGLYNQSRFEPELGFREGLAAFAERHARALAWGRLPPLVFFSMSRRFFRASQLKTSWLARVLGRCRAFVQGRPVSRLDLSFFNLLIDDGWYRVHQWVGRLLKRPGVRVSGLLINVTTSLHARPELRCGEAPMSLIRRPQAVPESIPGNPMLELFRDRDGVQVMLQAQYHPLAISLFLDAYQTVVARVAQTPGVPLADVVEGLGTFEGLDRLPALSAKTRESARYL